MKQRERFASRLGFILISAGCAIGLGNVWRFPYITGQYGGAAFVILYLIFLAIFGIPVMAMEFSVGRASQKSPVKSFEALEPKGSKWHVYGYFAMAGNYLLMMFYTTISGWILYYLYATAAGKFTGLDADGVGAAFGGLTQNWPVMILCMALVTILCFGICSMGLRNGVEKITKVMMLCLLAIILVLAIRSTTLEGASEGLKFYLLPNFDHLMYDAEGKFRLFESIYAALGQAFFTLSLGIGSMAIFGSYLGKEKRLLGESVSVTILDTFVALMAGLIIFPACSAYGVEANSGPGLIFVTLPNVFNNMPGGRFWGTLFFVFMSFAALSTVIAVFENIISCCMDQFGWDRKKASVFNCIALLILALPCIFGFNLLSGFNPLGPGTIVLDLEDFFVSNVLLPLGSIIYLLFCVTRYGWGWKNFQQEVNAGEGMKFSNSNGFRYYVTFGIPIVMLIIFFFGMYDKFKFLFQ